MGQLTLVEPRREVACFMSDPPWPERGGGQSKRGADAHYEVARVRDITGIMRGGLRDSEVMPAANAHHWMWVTDNYLPGGLWCLQQLGFEYVRTAVWVKARPPSAVIRELLGRLMNRKLELADVASAIEAVKVQTGLGQYLRGSHELMLLGVRGSGLDPSVRTEFKDVPSVIYGRRTKHSKKPDSAFELVERVSKGPRLEMFARSMRPGWESWGNEVAA